MTDMTSLAKVLKAMGIVSSETQAMEKAKEVFYFSQKMVRDFEEKKAKIVEKYYARNSNKDIEVERKIEVEITQEMPDSNKKEFVVNKVESNTLSFDVKTSNALEIRPPSKPKVEEVKEEPKKEEESYKEILHELEHDTVEEPEPVLLDELIEEKKKEEEDNIIVRELSVKEPERIEVKQEEKEEKEEKKNDLPKVDLSDIFNFSKK